MRNFSTTISFSAEELRNVSPFKEGEGSDEGPPPTPPASKAFVLAIDQARRLDRAMWRGEPSEEGSLL